MSYSNIKVTEQYLLDQGFSWNKPLNIMEKPFPEKNRNGRRMSLWYSKKLNLFLLDDYIVIRYQHEVEIMYKSLSSADLLPKTTNTQTNVTE